MNPTTKALLQLAKDAAEVASVATESMPPHACRLALSTALDNLLFGVRAVATTLDVPERRFVRLQELSSRPATLIDPAAVIGVEEATRAEYIGTLLHLAGGDTTFVRMGTDEACKKLGLNIAP